MGVSETLEELILKGLENLGVARYLFLELGKLLLKGLLLFTDQTAEKLLLKTALCDSEIDNGGLGGKLWGEVRIGKTRSHVESELVIVVHLLIGDSDELASTFDDDLSLENWIKHWVDFILDGLDEDWPTFLEWDLEGILEVWMRKSEDGVLLEEEWLSVSDPSDGLTLRIDHEWVSG